MNKVIFYTDGACSGNPGPGGYAFVIEKIIAKKDDINATIHESKIYEAFYNFDQSTTNNRMEMLAIIGALEYCLQNNISQPTIYSDSKYVIDGITQWIQNWKKNNWLTAAKKPVKNQDLWIRLDALMIKTNPNLQWVKGHSNNIGNNLADQIAVCAITDHVSKDYMDSCKCKTMLSFLSKWDKNYSEN